MKDGYKILYHESQIPNTNHFNKQLGHWRFSNYSDEQ